MVIGTTHYVCVRERKGEIRERGEWWKRERDGRIKGGRGRGME